MFLKDKVVLITGASSGIGEACAEQFAKAGAKLLLCSRRVEVVAQLAVRLKTMFGAESHVFACDVRDHQAVKQAIAALPAAWQEIDVLINNAGLAAGLDTIQDADAQDWEEMIDTNVKGLLYVTKAILPKMIAKNAGHIVNIGSIAGHTVYSKGVVYCATKKAVRAISEGLRMDLFGTKVRVSNVDPGAVETNFSTVRFKGDEKRAAAIYEGFNPLTAQDVADAVLYCATRPLHVNVSEVTIMPTAQAAATMIARNN